MIFQFFEALMLICFGASWPVAVIKALKARTAKGVSLASSCLILTGYLFGIIYKIGIGPINYVLIFYFFNFSIVLTHVIVIIRNIRIDQQTALLRAQEQS